MTSSRARPCAGFGGLQGTTSSPDRARETTFAAPVDGGGERRSRPRRGRQHQDDPANLRQERPKQQPQHREVIGTRLNGAPAHPRHQLGEVGGLGFGLGDNLCRGLGLACFQLGDLGLTDLAGDCFAQTSSAGFVPLCPGHIERMVDRSNAFGLPVGPGRLLVSRDDAGHAEAVREGEDRDEGEKSPCEHLPSDRKRQRPCREEEYYRFGEYAQSCRKGYIGECAARRGVPHVDPDAKQKETIGYGDQGIVSALGRHRAGMRGARRNRDIGFDFPWLFLLRNLRDCRGGDRRDALALRTAAPLT
jgi:hypothetical protein